MEKDALWIDTKIAYEPKRKLAEAYNRAMEATTAEWVLFLDQDVTILNPHWYEMCLHAIRTLGTQAGWITAVCNRIGSKVQKAYLEEDTNDIIQHIKKAEAVYRCHGRSVIKIKRGNFSGFFILTNKKAWEACGKFQDVGLGMSGIDVDYCKRLRRTGYDTYLMPGLYFFHLWKRKWNAEWKW